MVSRLENSSFIRVVAFSDGDAATLSGFGEGKVFETNQCIGISITAYDDFRKPLGAKIITTFAAKISAAPR